MNVSFCRRCMILAVLGVALPLSSNLAMATSWSQERLAAGGDSQTIHILGWDLIPILEEGTPAPGEEEFVISTVNDVALNGGRQLAILARLKLPASRLRQSRSRVYLWQFGRIESFAGSEIANSGGISLNERGTAAFYTREEAIVVSNLQRILFSVQPGEPSPLGDGTTLTRLRIKGLDDHDRLYFTADLSDGREGMFRADGASIEKIRVDGDPLPGTQFSYPPGTAGSGVSRVGSNFLVSLNSYRLRSIVRYDDSGGQTILAGSRDLPEKTQIQQLTLLDIDEEGRILFSVNNAHLYLWDLANFNLLIDVNKFEPLGPGTVLGRGHITDQGVVFGAVIDSLEVGGGIFRIFEERVEKIIADGDLSPWGDVVRVTNNRLPGWIPNRSVLPFLPFSGGGVLIDGSHFLLWEAGQLSPVGPRDGQFESEGLFSNGQDLVAERDGALLFRIHRGERWVLCWALPAAPRNQVLPLAVETAIGDLRFDSTIQVRNVSPVESTATVELLDGKGNTLSIAGDLRLGSFARVDLSPNSSDLAAASVRVTVSSGAEVIPALRLEEFEGVSILSRSSLAAVSAESAFHILPAAESNSATPLAIRNPSDEVLDLNLISYGPDGSPLGNAAFDVPANQLLTTYAGSLLGHPSHQAGRLELKGSRPFQLAAFSQIEDAIFQLPAHSSVPADWGVRTLFPLHGQDRSESFAVAPNGQVAVAFRHAGAPQVWLVNETHARRIFGPGPEAATPEIESVNSRGQVLFSLEGQKAGSPVNLLLWDGSKVRQIDSWPADSFWGKHLLTDSGVVVSWGDEVRIREGTESRLVVREGDPVPGGGEWGQTSWTQFDDQGVLYFGARHQLGRFDGSQVELLLRSSDIAQTPDVSSFYMRNFRFVEGELLFSLDTGAGGLVSQAATYRFLRGREVERLIGRGDRIDGNSDLTVVDIHRQTGSPEIINLRAINDEGIAHPVMLRFLGPGRALETLIVVDSEDDIESIWSAQTSSDGAVIHARQFNEEGGFWIVREGRLEPIFLEGRPLRGEQEGLPVSPRQFRGRWRFEDRTLRVPIRTTSGEAFFLATQRTRRRIIPFLLSGGFGGTTYNSTIRLSNADSTNSTVEIRVRDFHGFEVLSQSSVLAGHATSALSLSDRAPLFGWAEVVSEGSVESEIQIQYPLRGKPAEAFLPGVGLRSKFTFPSELREEALVLVNPGPREAQIVIEILGPGIERMEELLTISPFAQLIWIPEGSAPALPEQGVMNVQSDFPIAALFLSLADELVTRTQGN